MIIWQPVPRAAFSSFKCKHSKILSKFISMRICLGAFKRIYDVLFPNIPRGLMLGFAKHQYLMQPGRTAYSLLQPRHYSINALPLHSKELSVSGKIHEGSVLDARSLPGDSHVFIPGHANSEAFKRGVFTANIEGTDLLEKLDILIQEDEHAFLHALENLNIRIDTDFVCQMLNHQKDLNRALKFFRCATKKDNFEHNSRTYNLVLGKLAFTEPAMACEMVHEMLRMGYWPEAYTLDMLLETLVSAGLLDGALILIQMLGSGNSFVDVHRLVKRLESMSRYKEAFAIFYRAKAEGCLLDEATYIHILLLHLKLGQTKEACNLFMDTKDKGVNYNNSTYDSLIMGLCKNNDVIRAFEIFGVMKKMNCRPAVPSYCQLVVSLGCVGRLQEASEILKEAEAKYGVLNVDYYNDLISGMGKASQLEYAFKLLEHMKSFSLSPSLSAYGGLITGLCKAGRLETACELFDEMTCRLSTSDAFTFENLLVALAKADQPSKAISFFKRMEEKGFPPNSIIYCSLIRCLQYAGRLKDAYELFREMRMKGFLPHRDMYNRLLVSLAKGEKLEEMLYLYEDMKTLSWVPNTLACSAVLKMLFDAQDIETFQRFSREMLEKGCHFDKATRNIILNLFNVTRKWSVDNTIKPLNEPSKNREIHLLLDHSVETGQALDTPIK